MLKKEARQKVIIDLIEKNDIATQEELCELLEKEGYKATQATVSRDIRELSLSKVPSEKTGLKYVRIGSSQGAMEEKYSRVLRDGFVAMDKAQSIIVLRTVAGMAMAVAAAIDAMHLKEVSGCIAGDDTVMLAIREAGSVDQLMAKIKDIVNP
ncbi:MAG: arginine repressor [Lachnospiraceae bacterium]|nr:arginine repressor [Lachnospiraceae bacterium]